MAPGGGLMAQLLSAISGKLVSSALEGIPKMLFDSGGWLEPGLTLAVNKTGQRERVLGPEDTAEWERMKHGRDVPPIQVHNHYPVNEPVSTATNRSLQYAAALGVVV